MKFVVYFTKVHVYFCFPVKEQVEVNDTYKHRADKLDKKKHNHSTGIVTEYFNPGRLDCLKGLCDVLRFLRSKNELISAKCYRLFGHGSFVSSIVSFQNIITRLRHQVQNLNELCISTQGNVTIH